MRLSIALVWNMKWTTEEAAIMEDDDDKLARAAQMSRDDSGKAQGKPGESPKSITELLAAIECCIIHLEAFMLDKGQHQRMVHQLRAVLREKYIDGPLVQSQLDDIFWSVFLDGRQYLRLT